MPFNEKSPKMRPDRGTACPPAPTTALATGATAVSGPYVVVFTGAYDLAVKNQLRAELDALRCIPDLVLDLSQVTHLDSVFITELLRLHKARTAAGFPTESVVVRHFPIRKIFETLGLHKLVDVVGTIDAAIPKDGSSAHVVYAGIGNP